MLGSNSIKVVSLYNFKNCVSFVGDTIIMCYEHNSIVLQHIIPLQCNWIVLQHILITQLDYVTTQSHLMLHNEIVCHTKELCKFPTRHGAESGSCEEKNSLKYYARKKQTFSEERSSRFAITKYAKT